MASYRNRLKDEFDEDDDDEENEKDVSDKIEENVTNARERRFREFASVEYNDEIYMTPVDFLESVITERARRMNNEVRFFRNEFFSISSYRSSTFN